MSNSRTTNFTGRTRSLSPPPGDPPKPPLKKVEKQKTTKPSPRSREKNPLPSSVKTNQYLANRNVDELLKETRDYITQHISPQSSPRSSGSSLRLSLESISEGGEDSLKQEQTKFKEAKGFLIQVLQIPPSDLNKMPGLLPLAHAFLKEPTTFSDAIGPLSQNDAKTAISHLCEAVASRFYNESLQFANVFSQNIEAYGTLIRNMLFEGALYLDNKEQLVEVLKKILSSNLPYLKEEAISFLRETSLKTLQKMATSDKMAQPEQVLAFKAIVHIALYSFLIDDDTRVALFAFLKTQIENGNGIALAALLPENVSDWANNKAGLLAIMDATAIADDLLEPKKGESYNRAGLKVLLAGLLTVKLKGNYAKNAQTIFTKITKIINTESLISKPEFAYPALKDFLDTISSLLENSKNLSTQGPAIKLAHELKDAILSSKQYAFEKLNGVYMDYLNRYIEGLQQRYSNEDLQKLRDNSDTAFFLLTSLYFQKIKTQFRSLISAAHKPSPLNNHTEIALLRIAHLIANHKELKIPSKDCYNLLSPFFELSSHTYHLPPKTKGVLLDSIRTAYASLEENKTKLSEAIKNKLERLEAQIIRIQEKEQNLNLDRGPRMQQVKVHEKSQLRAKYVLKNYTKLCTAKEVTKEIQLLADQFKEALSDGNVPKSIRKQLYKYLITLKEKAVSDDIWGFACELFHDNRTYFSNIHTDYVIAHYKELLTAKEFPIELQHLWSDFLATLRGSSITKEVHEKLFKALVKLHAGPTELTILQNVNFVFDELQEKYVARFASTLLNADQYTSIVEFRFQQFFELATRKVNIGLFKLLLELKDKSPCSQLNKSANESFKWIQPTYLKQFAKDLLTAQKFGDAEKFKLAQLAEGINTNAGDQHKQGDLYEHADCYSLLKNLAKAAKNTDLRLAAKKALGDSLSSSDSHSDSIEFVDSSSGSVQTEDSEGKELLVLPPDSSSDEDDIFFPMD